MMSEADRQEQMGDATREKLRQFIARIERLEAEKQDLMQDQKEIMAEAKGNGFNVKALRKIIADRKRDADDLAEEQAIVELYKSALGI